MTAGMLIKLSGTLIFLPHPSTAGGSFRLHAPVSNLLPALTVMIKHMPKALILPTPGARNIEKTSNLKTTIR